MENNESFIMRWSRFFITRYRISILIMIAILIAGLWGATNNQRQDFPPIPVNIAFVTATYPGASPADVEKDVIAPIEQEALNIDTVESVRSTAQNSFGTVQATLSDTSKLDETVATLSEEINKLGLPSEVETTVRTFEAAGPAIALGLVGEGKDTEELLGYAEDIKLEIESSSNEIDYIEISPSNEFEVKISLDADALARIQLSYDAVKQLIQSQIVTLPGGSVVNDDGIKNTITVAAPVQDLDELKSISLGRINLEDVAEITRAPKNSDTVHYVGYVKDGQAFAKESVYLMVYKKTDGDIININNSVEEKINEIKEASLIPADVDLVVGYTIAPYVESQLDSLLNNGYLGLILILIVLLFFINLRTAVVVALAIPIVFLIALFAMYILGYSLNILTLFAMILTLGILVDNAIVIAEGMVHELEKGASRLRAALTSVKKLGPAVLTATLTTIVVFIPFANLGGIMGDFLKFIPYTIIIIIASSYFVAVTIMPLIGRWLLKEETYDARRAKKLKSWQKMLILPAIVHYGQNVIDRITISYSKLMEKIYSRHIYKVIVIFVVTVLIGVSFGYFAPRLEFEQFPSKDGETIQVDFTFPAGLPLAEKKALYQDVQEQVIDIPYFETFYTFGDTIFATYTEPQLRTDDTTIFELNDQLEEKLKPIREELSEEFAIKTQATSFGPPISEYDIIIEFTGNDPAALSTAREDLEEFLAEEGDIDKIFDEYEDSLVTSIDVEFDDAKLNSNGVNALAAAGTVNAVFSQQAIGSLAVEQDGSSDDIILNFDSDSTDSIQDLRGLTIPSATRGFVSLEDVASIQEVSSSISTKRLDGRKVATINIAVKDGGDINGINQRIKDYLDEDKLVEYGLPKDGVVYGGEFAEFESDYSNLQIVFILAVIAVYIILVWQFYSYFQPALILFAVPLALIGVFPGLWLINSSLNMVSGLGVIALVGIVVNDAIVFIAAFNRYKTEYPEENISQRLVRTGRSRFKPIFSTSITTIGGILPLTIYDPFWTGLGTAIIAGLIFSTMGTLIAIPTLYSFLHSMGNFLKKKLSFRRQPEIENSI